MKQFRIFTVDDDIDDWESLKEAFEENDCEKELTHFFTYEALLQQLEHLPDDKLPHLIILDNWVQGTNGHTTVEAIRSNPRFSSIKLAIYSTSIREKMLTDYKVKGVDLCIEKGNSLTAIKEDVVKFFQLAGHI